MGAGISTYGSSSRVIPIAPKRSADLVYGVVRERGLGRPPPGPTTRKYRLGVECARRAMLDMQVAPGIHRFSHGISNFYVCEEAGRLCLIDAGVQGDWGLLSRGLAALGHPPTALAAIVLTHAHADHTGFAEGARSEWSTPVWVHEADRVAATTGRAGKPEAGFGPYLRYLEAWRTLFGLLAHGGTRVVPIHVVSSFGDAQQLDLPGRPKVIHLPGHTQGMAALHSESLGALFTGDALVTRNPLTGRTGPQIMPRALNQDSARALASLARIADLSARLLLPGHGEPWTEGPDEAVRRARAAGPS